LEVDRVEGGGTLRAKFRSHSVEPVGIASREDDLGAFGPGFSGCLEAYTGATADHDDGLPDQLRRAWRRTHPWCVGHHSSDRGAGR
jgi:hypothetical protein